MNDPLEDVLTEVESTASRERLGELLGLSEVNRTLRRVRVHGRGGRAYVRLDLDNGDRIEFDPLGSYSSPSKMNFEIASQTGARPKLKGPDVQEVVTLIYWLGEREEASQTADRAWELGAEYLREAVLCDVEMGDQASRWRAFSHLDAKGTRRHTVLHDLKTGSRYVRTQWLMEYLRSRSDAGESAALRSELERGGWRKAGTDGRVKETAPEFGKTLQWAFLIVPEGWEHQ
jgi:hypothetical protein